MFINQSRGQLRFPIGLSTWERALQANAFSKQDGQLALHIHRLGICTLANYRSANVRKDLILSTMSWTQKDWYHCHHIHTSCKADLTEAEARMLFVTAGKWGRMERTKLLMGTLDR